LKKEAKFWRFAACLVLACAAAMATAQEPPAANGGCRLNNGHLIATHAAPSLPDIAAASYDRHTGKPVIYFNPRAVAHLPPPFREFVHAHECAHHTLDHLRAGPVGTVGESEADCWAAAELTAQGVLSPKDIALVGKVLALLLPGDRSHRAGHVRASELQRCVRYARSTTPDALAALPTQ
jgi:hypothetical protein